MRDFCDLCKFTTGPVVNLHTNTFKLIQNDYLFTGQCKWFVTFTYLSFKQTITYRSNRSFNIASPATPWGFDFCENYCSNSPLPGPKCLSNAPHLRVHSGDQTAPTPGTFHRDKNDRRTAETPSVVEQNLYKYNKN